MGKVILGLEGQVRGEEGPSTMRLRCGREAAVRLEGWFRTKLFKTKYIMLRVQLK